MPLSTRSILCVALLGVGAGLVMPAPADNEIRRPIPGTDTPDYRDVKGSRYARLARPDEAQCTLLDALGLRFPSHTAKTL
jgi:hypothetical protein